MRLFLVVAAALVATALARPVSDVARDAFEDSVLTPQEPPTKKPGQLVEPLYNGPGRFQFGALLHFGAPLAWDMQRITPQVPGADESNPPSLSKKQPPTIFEGVPLESDYDTRDLQPMDTTAG